MIPEKNASPGQDTVAVSKIEGALLGAAVGDALGWPQEMPRMRIDRPAYQEQSTVPIAFQSWTRRAGGRFWSHAEEIKAGEYSDDTQLLLATARSLKQGHEWLGYFYRYELPAWLIYERGGGRATRASAQQWEKGTPPWRSSAQENSQWHKYFTAGGNGVAMRVLPHALLRGQTSDLLCQQVTMNGIATHAHPRALVGAQLYAHATWIIARLTRPLGFGELIEHLLDEDKSWGMFPEKMREFSDWLAAANRATSGRYLDHWSEAVEEVRVGLRMCQTALKQGAMSYDRAVMEQLGCFDPQVSGAGTVTAVAAVYLASRYAVDPATGLLQAAFTQGADTDTVASMVGGLLGALHGPGWLPADWEIVQDKPYVLKLAHALASVQALPDSTIEPPAQVWNDRLSKQTLQELDAGAESVLIGPLGNCQVQDVLEHTAIVPSIEARSWRLYSEVGQTVYIKKLVRNRLKPIETIPEPLLKEPFPVTQIPSPSQAPVHPERQTFAPGIYANVFEVILHAELAAIMIAPRDRFANMRDLRDELRSKSLQVEVYAWGDAVFGYGRQADVLQGFGFERKTIVLREHPHLTARMILDGFVRSLEQGGYTCEWRKGVAKVHQFARPLFETGTGVRMFRGFELRNQVFSDSDEVAFGIVVDATFAYRDRANRPLSTADIVARFGSETLKVLRQKQGDLALGGRINPEVSRQRLLEQTLPFIDARRVFTLECGVSAELVVNPMRIVLLDEELST